MAIYLPSVAEESEIMLDDLTPKEIVSELDKYVVGQHDAKRADNLEERKKDREHQDSSQARAHIVRVDLAELLEVLLLPAE